MLPVRPANKAFARCAVIQARLGDYIDGLLTPADLAETQTHLQSCDACRREAARLGDAERALASARHAIPPAGDMRPAFYARLAASTPTSARWRLDWRLAVPALAGCALLGALYGSNFHAPAAPSRVASAPTLALPTEPASRLASSRDDFAVSALRPDALPQTMIAAPPSPVYRHPVRVSHRVASSRRTHRRERLLKTLQMALASLPPTLNAPTPAPAPRAVTASASDGGAARLADNEVAMGVCDEDRGFVASTREARNDSNVVTIETRSAPAATLFPLR